MGLSIDDKNGGGLEAAAEITLTNVCEAIQETAQE
jgi:hypothetical protein